MRRPYVSNSMITIAVLLFSALVASAQTGQLRGSVKLTGADGNAAPAAGAIIDVYRTDISGEFHTKTDKKGEWVFAGLPFVGTYVVSVSAPGARPSAIGGVKAGREIPVDVVLQAGDGKKLTQVEALALARGGAAAGPSTSGGGGGESAADKAKAAEIAKKNAEIEAKNKKIETSNQVVTEAFKAGNVALNAGNEADRANKHDEAIKFYSDAVQQYDIGLAADPEQAALLTNKSAALKARGVDKYNAGIKDKDAAATEAAKADFKAAAEAANAAADLLKKEPAATDPTDQKRQEANKYAAFSVRAEAMRLYVTKTDSTQADAGAAAFQDYISVETDPAKKARAQLDLAQMLLDAGSGDKAYAEYQKILAANPDDVDANLGAGLSLFSTGDKGKYQEAANYLQHFVDKAPDTHKFKNDAKDILAELKSTENVTPQKTTTTRPKKRP